MKRAKYCSAVIFTFLEVVSGPGFAEGQGAPDVTRRTADTTIPASPPGVPGPQGPYHSVKVDPDLEFVSRQPASEPTAGTAGRESMQGLPDPKGGADLNTRHGLFPVEEASQLLVVVTDEWTSVRGTLTRYERWAGIWQPIGDAIAVVVGTRGLGWGLGLHSQLGDGPRKNEGDRRAPAGIFRLTEVFGSQPFTRGATRMPYRQTHPRLVCVDDPRSSFYNTFVDETVATAAPERGYRRSEPMFHQHDGLYAIGVVIAQNSGLHVEPGRGSCIFLHVWPPSGTGTAGCTATDRESLESIVRWLDPGKMPLLIQLPKGELNRARTEWHLP